MTIEEIKNTIQTWIRTTDDEYDREEMGRVYGLKSVLRLIEKLDVPDTKWIPVSEKLPEVHQDVLLSLRSLDVVVGFRAANEPYFYCQGDYIEPQNVLAWMPKPKSYKAESA